jgi:5-methyltetrahydropteroyltriglutamate--homocysteine methyltransferase
MKLPAQQQGVVTSIVGSYPKPAYLYNDDARELINSTGFLFDAHVSTLGTKFKALADKAAQEAIEDQNESGIDIVTDGEERRGQYVMYVLKGLEGIDFHKLQKVQYRGGVYERLVPTITGPINYAEPIVVDDFLFTKKHAAATAKICLPGPSTAIDSLVDEHYRDLRKAAFAYAAAIRNEVEALVAAGCTIIQFDDPVLLRFPDRAQEWGVQALEACFAGLEEKATFIVHICRGYPNKPLEKQGIEYKANKDYYRQVLAWLASSKLDAVSIEGAQSNLDLSVLPAIGTKTIMLGVLDVGVNEIETVKFLVARGKKALQYVPKNQLILAPDCGMVELSRAAARKKLKNLALAAKILNGNV